MWAELICEPLVEEKWIERVGETGIEEPEKWNWSAEKMELNVEYNRSI